MGCEVEFGNLTWGERSVIIVHYPFPLAIVRHITHLASDGGRTKWFFRLYESIECMLNLWLIF